MVGGQSEHPGDTSKGSVALLRNGMGHEPADWSEVTLPDGSFAPDGYYSLYERRLLPAFQHVNDTAMSQGRTAFVTMPGLGGGQFAGPLLGQLGTALQVVLQKFFTKPQTLFPAIVGVYYDP